MLNSHSDLISNFSLNKKKNEINLLKIKKVFKKIELKKKKHSSMDIKLKKNSKKVRKLKKRKAY